MHVQLSPQLEALIQEKIDSGTYHDASEVLEDALRLLDEQERRAQRLRAAVAEGFMQIERGESGELTPERTGFIMRRAVENARREKPVKDDVKP